MPTFRCLSKALLLTCFSAFAAEPNIDLESMARGPTGDTVLHFRIGTQDYKVLDHDGLASASVITFLLTQNLAQRSHEKLRADESATPSKLWEASKGERALGFGEMKEPFLLSLRKASSALGATGNSAKKAKGEKLAAWERKFRDHDFITYEELNEVSGILDELSVGLRYQVDPSPKSGDFVYLVGGEGGALGNVLASRPFAFPLDRYARGGPRKIGADFVDLQTKFKEKDFQKPTLQAEGSRERGNDDH